MLESIKSWGLIGLTFLFDKMQENDKLSLKLVKFCLSLSHKKSSALVHSSK